MTTEVKSIVDELGRSFEQFKKANDEANTSMKKEFADNLNKHVGDLEEKFDRAIAALNRSGNTDEEKLEEAKIALKAALVENARTGASTINVKGLSSGSANSGGDTIPVVLDKAMGRIVTEWSPILQHAAKQTGSNSKWVKTISQGGAGAAFIGETGSRAGTNTPTTRKVEVVAHELYAYPETTLAVLEDSEFDLDAWLQDEVAISMATVLNDKFINGTGSNQPSGFLSETAYTRGSSWGNVKELTLAGAYPTIDKLITATESLATQYQQNAKWFGNRAMRAYLRTLKDGDDRYFYEHAVNGAPAKFNGYEFVECPDIANLGGSGPSSYTGDALVFADMMKFYGVYDRKGMTVGRDFVTSPGSVKFYFRKRIGGAVLDSNAGIVLNAG